MVWILNEFSQENFFNIDIIYVQIGKKFFVIEKDGMMYDLYEYLFKKKMYISCSYFFVVLLQINFYLLML